MSYQVIARKWRPQQFDDVVGQQAVTRTLRNALASGRLAQAFVFAGPRGVGKTTTARILARALNCEKGPTADPCGDVRRLRRDRRRARHRRARDRRRDAHRHRQRPRGDHRRPGDHAGAQPLQGLHHRRSAPAVERVVQRAAEVDRGAAAARRLHDGDDRARQDSRDRPVARRRSTSSAPSAPRRSPSSCARSSTRKASPSATTSLQLIARDADGSMRDAQSKLDQVIAFTGKTIDAGRRRDGARPGRPRPAARHAAGGGRRGRAGGVRARRPRRRDGLRPARSSAASCRASCATCWCCRSIRRASTIRRSPAKASASG